ncbi:MAG: hypothetical protein AABW99_03190 [archaeon]
MQVSHKKGILFRDKTELFVDASGLKNREAIITHAHSDHAKTSSTNTYYLTPETASLIGAEENGVSVKKIPFGKKFKLNEFECSFHSSGHILGSAQLKVSNGVDVVLTSDFKLQKSILFEPAEILPSNILVIESTFGLPKFSFPEREKVYEDMIHWMHSNISKKNFVVLGGYATGKAQELTKIVNEFLRETPLVHKKIFDQNKIYEKEGIKLGNYLELNHNLNESNVLIVPPSMINDHLLLALQHQLGRHVEAAIATGWNNYGRYKTFPLSDHADFNSLLRYVKESAPKMVLTTHGFENEFARQVTRRLGIPARPLSRHGQKTLGEFSS